MKSCGYKSEPVLVHPQACPGVPDDAVADPFSAFVIQLVCRCEEIRETPSLFSSLCSQYLAADILQNDAALMHTKVSDACSDGPALIAHKVTNMLAVRFHEEDSDVITPEDFPLL